MLLDKWGKIEETNDLVAIYHAVHADEGFEASAQILVTMVRKAQELANNKRRVLYLDIIGHRNSEGGFDHAMFELQQDFVLGFLLPYLSEVHLPLMGIRNPKPQVNDVPEGLAIIPTKHSNDLAAATQTELKKDEDKTSQEKTPG